MEWLRMPLPDRSSSHILLQSTVPVIQPKWFKTLRLTLLTQNGHATHIDVFRCLIHDQQRWIILGPPFFIPIRRGKKTCSPSSASRRSKCVGQSVLTQEQFPFGEKAHEAFLLCNYIKTLKIDEIPLRTLTASSALFIIIIPSTPTRQRRVMIDTKVLWEA